jgi:hypothetical protein
VTADDSPTAAHRIGRRNVDDYSDWASEFIVELRLVPNS